MTDEEKTFSIALPGEWALRAVLGPTLAEIGGDIGKLYAKGRDNIVSAASRKIVDIDDGKRANLRVARDVLWNGAFADDDICAEYFGGILASSRSDDGKSDEAIQFVDVIKSMSSSQLRMHYIVYNSLNRSLVSTRENINVAQSNEIQNCELCFAALELDKEHGLRVDTDPNVLHRVGLLWQYETGVHSQGGKALPYLSVHPTTFGVLVYAAAHNRFDEWRTFSHVNFGDFDGIGLPRLYASTKGELAALVGL